MDHENEVQEEVDRRRLAGAVAAEHGVNRAGRDLEADVVQGEDAVLVAFGEAHRFEQGAWFAFGVVHAVSP